MTKRMPTFSLTKLEVEKIITAAFNQDKLTPEFRFTPEYYERIRDEKERMMAYKELTVSAQIPDGIDVEIQTNPWRFLYLPENSEAGHVRAANIRLSKIWHPDLMDPRDPEKLEAVFKYLPHEFPIKGSTYLDWLEQLKDFQPKTDEEVLQMKFVIEQKNQEEIDAMEPAKREKFIALQKKLQELETMAEEIRRKMVTIGSEKMVTITKAVAAAYKKLGHKPLTFSGYDWEEINQTPLFTSWDSADVQNSIFRMLTRKFQDLRLEGEGVIRKELGQLAMGEYHQAKDVQPELAFDYGEEFGMSNDYRQSLDLKALFAWMELKSGNELAPSLLDDVVKTYQLNRHQQERLRLMLMNGETTQFIKKALDIKKGTAGQLERFIETLQKGPVYIHYYGEDDPGTAYSLGVEFSSQDELIFRFISQEVPLFNWGEHQETARFTPADLNLMRSIAYGPLLK